MAARVLTTERRARDDTENWAAFRANTARRDGGSMMARAAEGGGGAAAVGRAVVPVLASAGPAGAGTRRTKEAARGSRGASWPIAAWSGAGDAG